MTENIKGNQKITCDKCGTTSEFPEKIAGRLFFEQGWGFWPNAKKYNHVCRLCQTKKARKAHDFVSKNFNL